MYLALLPRLGDAPVELPCMNGAKAINVKTLTYRPADVTTSSPTFNYWVSQVMGQAMHFVIGTYADQGVEARDEWMFWAPIEINGNKGDAVFIARRSTETEEWHYSLFFYSKDQRLHDRLDACVFVATIGEHKVSGRVIGDPHYSEDGETPVSFFEITVKTDEPYALSLLNASQFV